MNSPARQSAAGNRGMSPRLTIMKEREDLKVKSDLMGVFAEMDPDMNRFFDVK